MKFKKSILTTVLMTSILASSGIAFSLQDYGTEGNTSFIQEDQNIVPINVKNNVKNKDTKYWPWWDSADHDVFKEGDVYYQRAPKIDGEEHKYSGYWYFRTMDGFNELNLQHIEYKIFADLKILIGDTRLNKDNKIQDVEVIHNPDAVGIEKSQYWWKFYLELDETLLVDNQRNNVELAWHLKQDPAVWDPGKPEHLYGSTFFEIPGTEIEDSTDFIVPTVDVTVTPISDRRVKVKWKINDPDEVVSYVSLFYDSDEDPDANGELYNYKFSYKDSMVEGLEQEFEFTIGEEGSAWEKADKFSAQIGYWTEDAGEDAYDPSNPDFEWSPEALAKMEFIEPDPVWYNIDDEEIKDWLLDAPDAPTFEVVDVKLVEGTWNTIDLTYNYDLPDDVDGKTPTTIQKDVFETAGLDYTEADPTGAGTPPVGYTPLTLTEGKNQHFQYPLHLFNGDVNSKLSLYYGADWATTDEEIERDSYLYEVDIDDSGLVKANKNDPIFTIETDSSGDPVLDIDSDSVTFNYNLSGLTGDETRLDTVIESASIYNVKGGLEEIDSSQIVGTDLLSEGDHTVTINGLEEDKDYEMKIYTKNSDLSTDMYKDTLWNYDGDVYEEWPAELATIEFTAQDKLTAKEPTLTVNSATLDEEEWDEITVNYDLDLPSGDLSYEDTTIEKVVISDKDGKEIADVTSDIKEGTSQEFKFRTGVSGNGSYTMDITTNSSSDPVKVELPDYGYVKDNLNVPTVTFDESSVVIDEMEWTDGNLHDESKKVTFDYTFKNVKEDSKTLATKVEDFEIQQVYMDGTDEKYETMDITTDANPTTDGKHSVTINNLLPRTEYQFVLNLDLSDLSTDVYKDETSGPKAWTKEYKLPFTVTTTPDKEALPPTITKDSITPVGKTAVNIQYTITETHENGYDDAEITELYIQDGDGNRIPETDISYPTDYVDGENISEGTHQLTVNNLEAGKTYENWKLVLVYNAVEGATTPTPVEAYSDTFTFSTADKDTANKPTLVMSVSNTTSYSTDIDYNIALRPPADGQQETIVNKTVLTVKEKDTSNVVLKDSSLETGDPTLGGGSYTYNVKDLDSEKDYVAEVALYSNAGPAPVTQEIEFRTLMLDKAEAPKIEKVSVNKITKESARINYDLVIPEHKEGIEDTVIDDVKLTGLGDDAVYEITEDDMTDGSHSIDVTGLEANKNYTAVIEVYYNGKLTNVVTQPATFTTLEKDPAAEPIITSLTLDDTFTTTKAVKVDYEIEIPTNAPDQEETKIEKIYLEYFNEGSLVTVESGSTSEKGSLIVEGLKFDSIYEARFVIEYSGGNEVEQTINLETLESSLESSSLTGVKGGFMAFDIDTTYDVENPSEDLEVQLQFNKEVDGVVEEVTFDADADPRPSSRKGGTYSYFTSGFTGGATYSDFVVIVDGEPGKELTMENPETGESEGIVSITPGDDNNATIEDGEIILDSMVEPEVPDTEDNNGLKWWWILLIIILTLTIVGILIWILLLLLWDRDEDDDEDVPTHTKSDANVLIIKEEGNSDKKEKTQQLKITYSDDQANKTDEKTYKLVLADSTEENKKKKKKSK